MKVLSVNNITTLEGGWPLKFSQIGIEIDSLVIANLQAGIDIANTPGVTSITRNDVNFYLFDDNGESVEYEGYTKEVEIKIDSIVFYVYEWGEYAAATDPISLAEVCS